MWRRSRKLMVALPAALALAVAPAISTGIGTASADPVPTPVLTNDLVPNPTGKVATPEDDVAHPGVTTEWWYASFMDPHSQRQLVVAIFSAPVPIIGAVMMYGNGHDPLSVSRDVPLPIIVGTHANPVPDGLPGVRTDQGEISYDPVRRAYHVRINSTFQVDAWLDHGQLPGATGIIDLQNRGQWMGWTNPVATSETTGWARMPGGQRIDLDGWRGYHDHNWGNFTMVDQAAGGWEWGVSHEPDGGASLIGGVVRRDGQWTGSVIDVRPTGTRICTSSTLTMSDWRHGNTLLSGATFSLPGTITAACGPDEPYHFSKTFHLTQPVVADGGLVAASAEAPYTTVPGSFGMFEHVRTLASRIADVARADAQSRPQAR